MKILYVAHKPPAPNKDGGTFAMKQFVDVLCDTKSADAFIISTQKHPYTSETQEFLESRFEKFDHDAIDTRMKAFPFLLSLILGKSYILERFQSKKLEQFVKANHYDLIICDSLSSLFAVDTATDKHTKLWVRSHNVEFAIWQGVAQQKSFYSRWLYQIQSRILKGKEIELINKVERNLCISSDDITIFNQLIPDVKNILVPIQVSTNSEEKPTNRECYFIGSDNWEPNIETVDYLIKCWKKPGFENHRLQIGGGFLNRYSSESLPTSVEFLGRIESAEKFALENGILVAPGFSGSGIRVKLLEALALGIPCITTETCAQGISGESGLIIVKNDDQLLDAIKRLKSDESYYESVSQKGKSYIQKKHSFAAVKQILVDELGE